MEPFIVSIDVVPYTGENTCSRLKLINNYSLEYHTLFTYEWPGIKDSCYCLTTESEEWFAQGTFNGTQLATERDIKFKGVKDGLCNSSSMSHCKNIPAISALRTSNISSVAICGAVSNSGLENNYKSVSRPVNIDTGECP